MATSEQYLENVFNNLDIVLTERQLSQFINYYKLLVEWNEKINLTAITEFEDVCVKHFLDSASIVKLFSSYNETEEYFKDKSIIDVGTGAGFPGICLKILFPELKVTLMDSLDKRIKFLDEVILNLSLEKIDTVHARVEEFAKKKEYREQFDFATARAVASLPVLSEYCLPFVKVGGEFIAYKSEKANEEVSLSQNAFSILGGNLKENCSFVLPKTDFKRSIIVIKKDKKTPSGYPRKAGTPVKKPL